MKETKCICGQPAIDDGFCEDCAEDLRRQYEEKRQAEIDDWHGGEQTKHARRNNMRKFFGTNHTITKENFRRLLWLVENDPKLAGKTVNELLNEVIEKYFEQAGLDAIMRENGLIDL